MATKKVARNAIEALSPRHRQAVRLLGEHVGRLQILLDRLKDPANQHDLTEAIHEAATEPSDASATVSEPRTPGAAQPPA